MDFRERIRALREDRDLTQAFVNAGMDYVRAFPASAAGFQKNEGPKVDCPPALFAALETGGGPRKRSFYAECLGRKKAMPVKITN